METTSSQYAYRLKFSKSLVESHRVVVSRYHLRQEMNEMKTTVFQRQNSSFNGIALNLQKLCETNEWLRFMVIENSFYLKCVNDKKRKYQFLIGV